jgi:hypothetical protein
MPSLFERRFNSQSLPMLNRTFGVSVTLSRGALTTAAFTARRNEQEYKALGHEIGIEVSIVMRDFYLPVSSLVLDGVAIEPRTGDWITEGDETYEISPPDNTKPSIGLLPGGYEYLVHTKRIEK